MTTSTEGFGSEPMRESPPKSSRRREGGRSLDPGLPEHAPIILGRSGGEVAGVVTPSGVDRRLAAEAPRAGRIVEDAAQLLRQVPRILGPAEEAVDAVLDDLGQCP